MKKTKYYTVKEGNEKGKKILLTDFMWQNKYNPPTKFVPATCAEDIFFRSSGVAQIFTNPKKKGEIVSEGTKTYLRNLWIQAVYNKRPDIGNNYTEKGLFNEQASIGILNELMDTQYVKNDEIHFKNEYITGCPDLISDVILDIKSSWNMNTYFKAVDSPVNKTYYYQLQAYMYLTGLTDSYLVYVLTSTPDFIVNDEIRRLGWSIGDTGEDDRFEALYQEIRENHSYEEIPIKERVCIKHFPRDEKVIEEFKERITVCRKFMDDNFF